MSWPRAGIASKTAGLAAAVTLAGVLVLAMLPFRPHLGASTCGLVLVVPVVVGVSLGGWEAGVGAVVVGFLAYDFLFLRPYGTLAVSDYRDWVTLAVYVAVMLVVARVVGALQRARAQARRSADDTRHLLEVSDLLIGDRSLSQLLSAVVETARQEFGLTSAAVLLPSGGSLEVAALAGEPLPERALDGRPDAADPAAGVALAGRAGLRNLPLATAERSIGVLVVNGPSLSPGEQRLLSIYANHAALAVERAQLREQALRSRVLAQVDSWRRALLASVAHDLRTPLASIKAAVSDLRDPSVKLSGPDRGELLSTADEETDRLTRMVNNLLDMYRIEAGTQQMVLESLPAQELAEEAIDSIRGLLASRPVGVEVPESLRVRGDRHLLVRVLVNLLENAARHTPRDAPVSIQGRERGAEVELSVLDGGPGLSPRRLAELFDPGPGGGPESDPREGAGVGLTICKAFVEANGGRIGASPNRGGGLRVDLLLPAG